MTLRFSFPDLVPKQRMHLAYLDMHEDGRSKRHHAFIQFRSVKFRACLGWYAGVEMKKLSHWSKVFLSFFPFFSFAFLPPVLLLFSSSALHELFKTNSRSFFFFFHSSRLFLSSIDSTYTHKSAIPNQGSLQASSKSTRYWLTLASIDEEVCHQSSVRLVLFSFKSKSQILQIKIHSFFFSYLSHPLNF